MVYRLVASKDGYWLGTVDEISAVIHRYIAEPKILYRETTHLWVTVPENLTAMIEALDALQ